MKTLFGTLLALGILSTAASAQYCPPYGYGQRVVYSGTFSTPSHTVAPKVVETPAPEVEAKPIEPAPLPAEPAPEVAPPK